LSSSLYRIVLLRPIALHSSVELTMWGEYSVQSYFASLTFQRERADSAEKAPANYSQIV